MTVRVVRPGAVSQRKDPWRNATMEERIEAVWTLTKLCYAWNREDSDEPRLQRSVVRVQRPHAHRPSPCEGITAPVLSRRHLIFNEKASGRLQDLADVEWLESDSPESGDSSPP